MTKDDLTKAVAEATGTSEKDARATVDATIKAMVATLSSGETIFLRGLGSLNVVTRKPRTVRDILKGINFRMAASKTVKFIPSTAIKKALNNRS
jgi:DNA-binding protein HU-beta